MTTTQTKLITYTEQQKRAANARWNDPWGWEIDEERANDNAREFIASLNRCLRLAIDNPDDPGCAELLLLIRAAQR